MTLPDDILAIKTLPAYAPEANDGWTFVYEEGDARIDYKSATEQLRLAVKQDGGVSGAFWKATAEPQPGALPLPLSLRDAAVAHTALKMIQRKSVRPN